MKSTKILLMAAHFHPYKGGLENFALDLGSRLAKRKIIVDVFTFNVGKERDYEEYNGVNIYRFPCKSILGKTWTMPKYNKKYEHMMQEILKNDYDAVITNTRFFTTSYIGMKIAKKLRKRNGFTKFIHVEHGNVHVIHSNPLISLIAWLWDNTFGRKIFRESDIVVGISEPCARFAKRFGARKTTVIHNSIDSESFTGTKKASGTFRIICVGRIIYAKGFQDLAKAAKGMDGLEIVFIGDGPFRKDLEAICKELGVKGIFTGTLNRSQIRDWLLKSDLFVNPSYSEGLPTSILEAGAAGLPVIATDVGGTAEIISTPKMGILFKPKDIDYLKKSILLLKKDAKQRESLGQSLKKNINEEFDWKRNIEKFAKLVKR